MVHETQHAVDFCSGNLFGQSENNAKYYMCLEMRAYSKANIKRYNQTGIEDPNFMEELFNAAYRSYARIQEAQNQSSDISEARKLFNELLSLNICVKSHY